MNTRLFGILLAAVAPFTSITAQAQTPDRPADGSIVAVPGSSIKPTPTAVAATPSNASSAVAPANGKAKSKKAPASAGGTWRWTTYNRSMQPCENVLTLTVAKNGKISGKLVDRTGEHEIKDATLGDGVVTFDVKHHTRGEGDLPHTYTVNLDPDSPQVSVDLPDLTPFGKAHGGKAHRDHSAKHDASAQ